MSGGMFMYKLGMRHVCYHTKILMSLKRSRKEIEIEELVAQTLLWRCSCPGDCGGSWSRNQIRNAQTSLLNRSREDQLHCLFNLMSNAYDKITDKFTLKIAGVIIIR